MIVRIATEGQYELKGPALAALDEMDDHILDAVEKNDSQAFEKALSEVLCHIRANGTRLPDSSLLESDLIMPPPDTTLEEARHLFADYPRELRS
ncbi:MAG TPA: hypothetical protein GXX29_13370 [Firmicutes bacterium]|nr:hypothetical protein [Bacillota bacterium]